MGCHSEMPFVGSLQWHRKTYTSTKHSFLKLKENMKNLWNLTHLTCSWFWTKPSDLTCFTCSWLPSNHLASASHSYPHILPSVRWVETWMSYLLILVCLLNELCSFAKLIILVIGILYSGGKWAWLSNTISKALLVQPWLIWQSKSC
jgi:hypothetical protein